MVYRGRRDIYICKNSNGSDNYVKNHQNVHQKVMETKKRFREEDGFNVEEALEAAVKKGKFLLNRIFNSRMMLVTTTTMRRTVTKDIIEHIRTIRHDHYCKEIY